MRRLLTEQCWQREKDIGKTVEPGEIRSFVGFTTKNYSVDSVSGIKSF